MSAWISVKDRLPEDSCKYMVSDRIHCSMALFSTTIREFYNIAGPLTNGSSPMTIVTHWQPLPAPPEE